jgi:hypothetical protein
MFPGNTTVVGDAGITGNTDISGSLTVGENTIIAGDKGVRAMRTWMERYRCREIPALRVI